MMPHSGSDSTFPRTECAWCGKINSRVLEWCQHCGKPDWTSAPVERLTVVDKSFVFIGRLVGWALMIMTGAFVVLYVAASRFPGDKLVLVVVGAAIWYGVCLAFRNNSPPVMRVLRWLFPYDSWTLADD